MVALYSTKNLVLLSVAKKNILGRFISFNNK